MAESTTPATTVHGSELTVGERPYPYFEDGRVFIGPNTYLEPVPEPVWKFRVGAYQVSEKWLKDRRGRTLTKNEVAHYQNILFAVAETARLMPEVDMAIDRHGGWPKAFASLSS
jgi:hypothetical protein